MDPGLGVGVGRAPAPRRSAPSSGFHARGDDLGQGWLWGRTTAPDTVRDRRAAGLSADEPAAAGNSDDQ